MLLAARQRGALIFEAFSNTPPYWMTVSGRSSGNVFPWLDNLRPEYYDQFVHYLTEVVRWYRDQHDITFRCLPPACEVSECATPSLCVCNNMRFVERACSCSHQCTLTTVDDLCLRCLLAMPA